MIIPPTDLPIVAFDLDRSLAQYSDYKGPTDIGEPIMQMVLTLFKHLHAGHYPVIYTARLSQEHTQEDRDAAEVAIKSWCRKWFGQEFPVTADKSPRIQVFYDDKAVGLVPNTGRRVDGKDGDVS